MSNLPVYQYLVAINTDSPPQAFLDWIEKFAPRFPLLGRVHILMHSTQLTLPQLRQQVESTLPPNVSFYVCVAPDGEFVPSREDQSAP